MCDYSLEFMKTDGKAVDAKIGDRLVTTSFPGTPTRGLSPVGAVGLVACCLLPGTELAFDGPIRVHDSEVNLGSFKIYQSLTGIFRKINIQHPSRHHDGIELPTGHMLTLSRLAKGQGVRVLQVPAPVLKVPTSEEVRIKLLERDPVFLAEYETAQVRPAINPFQHPSLGNPMPRAQDYFERMDRVLEEARRS